MVFLLLVATNFNWLPKLAKRHQMTIGKIKLHYCNYFMPYNAKLYYCSFNSLCRWNRLLKFDTFRYKKRCLQQKANSFKIIKIYSLMKRWYTIYNTYQLDYLFPQQILKTWSLEKTGTFLLKDSVKKFANIFCIKKQKKAKLTRSFQMSQHGSRKYFSPVFVSY